MSDFLINLGRNRLARKAVKTLGLPIPLPQQLKRQKNPYGPRDLQGKSVFLAGTATSCMVKFLDAELTRSGASFYSGSSPKTVEDTYSALVFDGTDLKGVSDLKQLYLFFHTMLPTLEKCGRVIVLARPAHLQFEVEAAATSRALLGFCKSLAKEIGKKGATAQVIYSDEQTEARLGPVLKFFLSDRSSFISGQSVHVSGKVAHLPEPKENKPFAQKTALVTGALRGIGRSIASQLAAEGAKVICVDLETPRKELEAFAKEISGQALSLDISSDGALDKIVSVIGSSGLDILVHNAGITRDKTLQNMAQEKWEQTLAINLGAVVSLTQGLLKGKLNQNARIVCLASIGGIAGVFGQTNYAASKAGVIGFVEALAPKIADKGMTINAVAPGFITTRMTDAMPFSVREVGRRFNALSQAGEPEDIAQLVSFLALPQAAGLTGQTIRVCGLNLLGS